MSINPFFEGDKGPERRMFQDHMRRRREVESTIDAEGPAGSPISNVHSNVNIKEKSFMSFLCSCRCIIMQCQFSRLNFFQVFERGNILSWLLPIGIKNKKHNGYEWNLKVYKDGTPGANGTTLQVGSPDETNDSLINE